MHSRVSLFRRLGGLLAQLHHLRFKCRCPVVFDSHGYIAEGHVVNLSLFGCAIEVPDYFIYGEYVRLRVLLPDEGMRIGLGKVRWLRTDQFGVEFLRVPEDHQGLIGRMIREELQAKTEAMIKLLLNRNNR